MQFHASSNNQTEKPSTCPTQPAINPAHPPWSAQGRAVPSSIPSMGHTQDQAVTQQNPPKQPAGKAWPPLSSQPIPQEASPAWVPSHTPICINQPGLQNHIRQNIHQIQSVLVLPSLKHHGLGQVMVTLLLPAHPNLSTYFQGSKAPSSSPKGYSSDAGASEGLNLKGKELNCLLEDSLVWKNLWWTMRCESQQPRSSSPTLSMPSTCKYSSNVRAPPQSPTILFCPLFIPLQRLNNPLLQLVQIKTKANKEKKNPPPKHLNVLDVMKHQPYQLNSSLFTYNSTPEAKQAVPPTKSKQTSAQTPTSFQTQSLAYEPSTAFSPSPNSLQSVKKNPSKATGEVSVPYPFVRQSTSNEATIIPQQLHGKELFMHDGPRNKGFSNSFLLPGIYGGNVCVGSYLPVNNEYASRCALPVAPRPKFSAKMSNAGGKKWKPVILQH